MKGREKRNLFYTKVSIISSENLQELLMTKLSKKGGIVMKLNKKKFIKFLFVASMMITCAFMENGNITGALILAMLI